MSLVQIPEPTDGKSLIRHLAEIRSKFMAAPKRINRPTTIKRAPVENLVEKVNERAIIQKLRDELSQIVEKAVKKYFDSPDYLQLKRHKLHAIMVECCKYYNLSTNNFLSKRRQNGIVKVRQVAMHLACQMTDCSLPEIGRRFRRDHTTVMHANRKYMALVANDPEIKAEIDELMEIIEASIGHL